MKVSCPFSAVFLGSDDGEAVAQMKCQSHRAEATFLSQGCSIYLLQERFHWVQKLVERSLRPSLTVTFAGLFQCLGRRQKVGFKSIWTHFMLPLQLDLGLATGGILTLLFTLADRFLVTSSKNSRAGSMTFLGSSHSALTVPLSSTLKHSSAAFMQWSCVWQRSMF